MTAGPRGRHPNLDRGAWRAAVPEWDFMQSRFLRAMGAYAVLALLAAFTLDGDFRIAVWILLAGLAVKTYIAHKTSDL